MEYYYCTKHVSFPMKDVIQKIYEYFNAVSKPSISILEICEYLKKEFNVKVFNHANLMRLLHSQGQVTFNTVKDLYIKYIEDGYEEDKKEYYILKKVFVHNRESVIDVVKVLGLEQLPY